MISSFARAFLTVFVENESRALNILLIAFCLAPFAFLNWSFLGKNCIGDLIHKAESCSGLVYDLLNAGGITNLIIWEGFTTKTTAPDSIARGVVLAYDIEQEGSSNNKIPSRVNKDVRYRSLQELNTQRSQLSEFMPRRNPNYRPKPPSQINTTSLPYFWSKPCQGPKRPPQTLGEMYARENQHKCCKATTFQCPTPATQNSQPQQPLNRNALSQAIYMKYGRGRGGK